MLNEFIQTHNTLIVGIVLGAVAILLAPLILRLPHYTWATILNLYFDLQHFGLIGTIKYRT